MSRLPDAANAIVEDAKIIRYLLNAAHRKGGAKSAFFASFGFSGANWLQLKSALLNHPLTNEITSQTGSSHGEKYAVSCNLATPDGRNPCIVSVWIIQPPSNYPRFVTAYPSG